MPVYVLALGPSTYHHPCSYRLQKTALSQEQHAQKNPKCKPNIALRLCKRHRQVPNYQSGCPDRRYLRSWFLHTVLGNTPNPADILPECSVLPRLWPEAVAVQNMRRAFHQYLMVADQCCPRLSSSKHNVYQ